MVVLSRAPTAPEVASDKEWRSTAISESRCSRIPRSKNYDYLWGVLGRGEKDERGAGRWEDRIITERETKLGKEINVDRNRK